MKKVKIVALIGMLSISLMGCNNSAPNNNTTNVNPNNTVNKTETIVAITPDKAKEIALNHAGLTSDTVTFVRVEKDLDNGREQYEVEFYGNGVEYDYEIDAEKGEIISYDADIEDFTIENNPSTNNDSTNSTNNQPNNSTTASQGISEEKAKEIALSHSGLTSDAVRFERVERDYDNGRQKFEIEFYANNVEYDYEIDATTGDILSYEK